MAFPNLVSAANFVELSSGGPYEISAGRVYQPAFNLAATLVQMWKSMDSGVTWAKVGSDQACGTGGSMSSATDGTKIFVLSSNAAQTFQQVSVFDTGSDTWTSTTVTTNALKASNPASGMAYRASDRQLIVAAPVQAFQFAVDDTRCGYFLFDAVALTWGPWIRCGSTVADPGVAWNVFSVLQGSGSTFWFLFLQEPSSVSGGTRNVVIQSLAGSVLGGLTTIATHSDASAVSFLNPGFSDGVHAIIAWQPDNTVNQVNVLEAPVSSMAFGTQTIAVAGGFTLDGFAVMCSAVAGFVLFLASDNGVTFPVDYYVDSGFGFGAKTNLGSQHVNFLFANKIASQPWGIIINGSTFYWQLVGAPPPPPVPAVPTSQLAFMGVRRVKGSDPLRSKYEFRPKDYIYNASIALNVLATGGISAPPQLLIQTITNYDFELYELRLRYRSAAGAFADPSIPFAKLWIYDPVLQQLSNLPILDLYVNGLPLSKYKNGALVPVLLYPNQSQIRIEFYSVITNAALLPVTCFVDFVGVQRVPCE